MQNVLSMCSVRCTSTISIKNVICTIKKHILSYSINKSNIYYNVKIISKYLMKDSHHPIKYPENAKYKTNVCFYFYFSFGVYLLQK